MRVELCRRVGLWGALATLTLGCNAVLDNQAGQLGDTDAGSDAPTTGTGAPFDGSVAIDSSPPPTPVPDATVPTPTPDASVTPTPVDSGALPVCAFGQKLCDGTCVAVDDPLFGCGATTCTACTLDRASATCAGSGCAIATCDPGYADCDQNPANGCETDLSQSTHCGTCNAQCGTAAPDCTPTATGFACATGCSGAAPTVCGAQCVDLQTSLDNCGACGTACPAVADGTSTCATGHCGFTCQADFHACGSACATDLSPASCGTSCAPCPTGPNAIPTCNGVACGMECEPSFANCNGLTADGCEVDLQTDPANCGLCGHSCAGQACNAGTCAVAPPVDAGTAPVDAGSPHPVDAGSDATASVVEAGGAGVTDAASE